MPDRPIPKIDLKRAKAWKNADDQVHIRDDGNYLIASLERGGRWLIPHYYILTPKQYKTYLGDGDLDGVGYAHTTKLPEALSKAPTTR